MRDALLSVENRRGIAVMGRIYDRKPAKFDAIVEAACIAYGQMQTGEAEGLPPHEPFTCGTNHLAAERTLRLVQRSIDHPGTKLDYALIEKLEQLVDDAGLGFARATLIRQQAASLWLTDEELPF